MLVFTDNFSFLGLPPWAGRFVSEPCLWFGRNAGGVGAPSAVDSPYFPSPAITPESEAIPNFPSSTNCPVVLVDNQPPQQVSWFGVGPV